MVGGKPFRPTHPLRAVAEALLITLTLFGLARFTLRTTGLVLLTTLGGGMMGGLIFALRARLPRLAWPRALLYDGGLALVWWLTLSGLLFLLTTLLSPPSALTPTDLYSLLLIVGGLNSTIFLVIRLVLRLWQQWQRVKAKRLRWAIVHAHLLTVLIILLIILGVKVMRSLPSGPLVTTLAKNEPGAILFWVSAVFFSLIGMVVIAIPLLAVVMGLVVLIATLTARPLTERLEALARAVGRFSQGDYASRATVTGEDEIAQLSRDFNRLADRLAHTLTDLQSERETITGLLQTQRELAATVSHELRTPVATLRGYLESLLVETARGTPSRLEQDLAIIEAEVVRLQTLIDDLFTLSQAEVNQLTLRCEVINIRPFIERVVETTAPLAWQAGRVQVVAEVPADLPPINADGDRLLQILHNLVHNSIRHTPPGGIVALTAQTQAETLAITVHDTGRGISDQMLPHIWDRFYRGPAGQTGLGLTLVKTLTEAMGGTVIVESKVGQGSHFTIELMIGR